MDHRSGGPGVTAARVGLHGGQGPRRQVALGGSGGGAARELERDRDHAGTGGEQERRQWLRVAGSVRPVSSCPRRGPSRTRAVSDRRPEAADRGLHDCVGCLRSGCRGRWSWASSGAPWKAGRMGATHRAHHDWEALYAEGGDALPWRRSGGAQPALAELVEREPLGQRVLDAGVRHRCPRAAPREPRARGRGHRTCHPRRVRIAQRSADEAGVEERPSSRATLSELPAVRAGAGSTPPSTRGSCTALDDDDQVRLSRRPARRLRRRWPASMSCAWRRRGGRRLGG